MTAEIELWDETASSPLPERETRSEPHGDRVVRNVTHPTLTPFVPEHPRLAAIICPGGGFRRLAIENEGTAVAEWLAERGVAAYVLKYRTLETPADDAEHDAELRAAFARPREEKERAIAEAAARIMPLALADAQQAVRLLAARHERVGVIGFSAGGRIAVAAALVGGVAFAAAIYPAALAGVAPPGDAPPLFLAVAADDPVVRAGDCVRLYQAWPDAELHVFARGGHGFGMRRQALPSDAWIDLLGAWLGDRFDKSAVPWPATAARLDA